MQSDRTEGEQWDLSMFMHTQLSIISGTIRCSQEIVGFRFLLRESFQSNLFKGERRK